MGALGAALRGTPRMSWHRRDRRGPRQGQINNEKPQVSGLRTPAKGLLADLRLPAKGGGEAAGMRYVAKNPKVLFGLRPDVVHRKLVLDYCVGARWAPAKVQTPPSYKENTPENTSRLLCAKVEAPRSDF